MPTLPAAGVPVKEPDAVSKLAHDGRFSTEKVSASPAVSAALGWNEYFAPAITVVAGVPEIEGGFTAAVSLAVAGAAEVAAELEELPSPPQAVARTDTAAHKRK